MINKSDMKSSSLRQKKTNANKKLLKSLILD